MKKHTQYLRAEHEAAMHTPGPWKLTNEGFQAGVIEAPNRGLGICEVFGGGETDKANAVLIAAAPDLLAALEAIRDGLNGCESTDELRNTAGMCIVQARAAINKAKTL